MPLLNPGDPFPPLTISTTDGQALTIPDAFAGDFAVVLFNRGAWCPFCNAQLRAFERAGDRSGDGRQEQADVPRRLRRGRPAVAELTGAFVNPDPVYLQSTGFVLDPAGNIIVSVYSSGAIGRLVPDDVMGLVRYARDHAA
jgi:hypothetical protein